MDPNPSLPRSLDVARACEITDVDPEYIHRLFDGYTNDKMADYSTFQRATGWEPEIDFEEGVTLVCEVSGRRQALSSHPIGHPSEVN